MQKNACKKTKMKQKEEDDDDEDDEIGEELTRDCRNQRRSRGR